MSKKSRNKGSDYKRKEPKTVNNLSDLKGAMAEVNATEANNVATEDSEAGMAARAVVVNEVAAKEMPVAKDEVSEFKGKHANSPETSPFPPKGKKGRPLPNKKTAEASAKALDITNPEVKHQVANEVKAAIEAKKEASDAALVDTLMEVGAELDKADEVITPDNVTSSPLAATGEPVIADSEDVNPDDDNNSPASMVEGQEEVNQDAIANPDALIAEEGVVIEAAAKEMLETTVMVENGEDELVSDLIGTSTENEVTESASDEPATVTESAPAVNEPEVVNEAPAISTDTETAAIEETQLGFSKDHLRKLESAWLKKTSEIYKIKSREEIKQMIIDEYATKPTNSIKGGEVLSRVKALSVKIYDDAHPKNAEKAAAKAMRQTTNAAAKSDATTISEEAKSTEATLNSDATDSSDTEVTAGDSVETTPEMITEAAAKGIEAPINDDVTNEAVTVDKPQPEEETVSIKLEEPVDTSEPVIAVAKGTGETEVPTAPEADNSIAEINAEGVATDEPKSSETVNTGSQDEIPVTDITENEIAAAKAVDTAGTVGNDTEVAATDSNQQDEVVTADQVSNDAPVVTPESEVKADAEATGDAGITPENVVTVETAETDATVNKEVASVELAEAATINAPSGAKADDAEKLGKPKKGAQILSHTGSIDDAMQLAGTLVKSAYNNVGNAKKYSEKNGKQFLKAWMKANKFDFEKEPVDYFEAAKSFVAVNNYNILEVDEDFNILDLIKELRKYRAMDWPIFSSLISALDNAEVHVTSDRQFIFLPEPKTREVDELRAKLSQVTIALANSQDEVKELTEVSENLIKRADHWEGIATALAENEVIEVDVITDPKVLSFHQRLKMEHKKLQPQESSSPRELSSLKKLVAKVVESILSSLRRQQVLRQQKKLSRELNKVESKRLKNQTLKMGKALLAHRQLFLRTQGIILPSKVKGFKGQAEPGTITWDYENQVIKFRQLMTEIRPLTLENRELLNKFRESPNLAGQSPMDRLNNQHVVHFGGSETSIMVIDNLQPGITPEAGSRMKPDNQSAPVIFDARHKEKPSETISDTGNNQSPIEQQGAENKSSALVVRRKFPTVPISIIERLDHFDKSNRNLRDGNYHILLVNDNGLNTEAFEETVKPWIEELAKEGSIEYTARDYIDHVRGLARIIGYPRHQTLDMFTMFSMSMDRAQGLLADLRGIDVSACLIQYPQKTTDQISIAEIWPEHIASNIGRARYSLDEKSEQYMKFIAASDMLTQPNKSIEWFIVRKSVELITLANNRIPGPAAYVNFYHSEELTTPQMLAIMVKNAPAQVGIPYVDNVKDALEIARKTKMIPPIVKPSVANQLAS